MSVCVRALARVNVDVQGRCPPPSLIHHPALIQDVVVGRKRGSVFLVFEYCDHDMAVLLDSMPRPFSESEVKCLMI